QKNFVKEYATQYSELSRLPYFDLVQQIVIDPMHNLFLGKFQPSPNDQPLPLMMLHNMLSDFVIPSSCGKLPTDISIPTGGSLTADQWLLLATVYGPLIRRLQQVVAKQAEKAQQVGVKKVSLTPSSTDLTVQTLPSQTSKKRKAVSQVVEGIPEGQLCVPPPPPGSMQMPQDPQMPCKPQMGDEPQTTDNGDQLGLHPNDPANFLKLLLAIHILIKHTITDNDIEMSVIKPNHHYATHIGDCAHNFGPLHDFWTFLFKRLNKVLKSFKANNHSNGELETTFFKEFHRTCETSRLVSLHSLNVSATDHHTDYETAVVHSTYQPREVISCRCCPNHAESHTRRTWYSCGAGSSISRA
ncbi:hypothetical protein BKA83DRAFT_4041526, partial [Pisolithus microcarpus]